MKKLKDMTEPELKQLMQILAEKITRVCVELECEKPLFTLLLFNDPEIAQYISNCNRHDMILALKETVNRLENKEDITR